MTVQIASIVLDDNLILEGIEISKNVSVSTVVTLGGIAHTTTMQLTGGRRLSLVSIRDGNTIRGKFLRSQVLEIRELAAIGQPVTLIHHAETYSIIIISTEGLVPLKKYHTPRPTDIYTGPIQVIEE